MRFYEPYDYVYKPALDSAPMDNNLLMGIIKQRLDEENDAAKLGAELDDKPIVGGNRSKDLATKLSNKAARLKSEYLIDIQNKDWKTAAQKIYGIKKIYSSPENIALMDDFNRSQELIKDKAYNEDVAIFGRNIRGEDKKWIQAKDYSELSGDDYKYAKKNYLVDFKPLYDTVEADTKAIVNSMDKDENGYLVDRTTKLKTNKKDADVYRDRMRTQVLSGGQNEFLESLQDYPTIRGEMMSNPDFIMAKEMVEKEIAETGHAKLDKEGLNVLQATALDYLVDNAHPWFRTIEEYNNAMDLQRKPKTPGATAEEKVANILYPQMNTSTSDVRKINDFGEYKNNIDNNTNKGITSGRALTKSLNNPQEIFENIKKINKYPNLTIDSDLFKTMMKSKDGSKNYTALFKDANNNALSDENAKVIYDDMVSEYGIQQDKLNKIKVENESFYESIPGNRTLSGNNKITQANFKRDPESGLWQFQSENPKALSIAEQNSELAALREAAIVKLAGMGIQYDPNAPAVAKLLAKVTSIAFEGLARVSTNANTVDLSNPDNITTSINSILSMPNAAVNLLRSTLSNLLVNEGNKKELTAWVNKGKEVTSISSNPSDNWANAAYEKYTTEKEKSFKEEIKRLDPKYSIAEDELNKHYETNLGGSVSKHYDVLSLPALKATDIPGAVANISSVNEFVNTSFNDLIRSSGAFTLSGKPITDPDLFGSNFDGDLAKNHDAYQVQGTMLDEQNRPYMKVNVPGKNGIPDESVFIPISASWTNPEFADIIKTAHFANNINKEITDNIVAIKKTTPKISELDIITPVPAKGFDDAGNPVDFNIDIKKGVGETFMYKLPDNLYIYDKSTGGYDLAVDPKDKDKYITAKNMTELATKVNFINNLTVTTGKPDDGTTSATTSGIKYDDVLANDLGYFSRRNESNDNPATISNGSKTGDYGGDSYGAYQFTTAGKYPTLPKFLEAYPEYGERLKGMRSGSRIFNREWEAIAEENPQQFLKNQHDYVVQNNVTPVYDYLNDKEGINIYDPKQRVLQEAIFEVSIQMGSGNAKKAIKNAFEDKGPMSDYSTEEFLSILYKHIEENTNTYWSSSDERTRASVKDRYKTSLPELLTLLKEEENGNI